LELKYSIVLFAGCSEDPGVTPPRAFITSSTGERFGIAQLP
jgi:hypothetical protein